MSAHDDTIVIYQKPTCTSCRQVYNALKEKGVAMDSVDYYLDPIPAEKLRELLRKMDMPARALLRTKEPIYRELGLATSNLSDDHIIDLMVAHPDLIQRPIVERGARAILARPAERLADLF
jgi:arsenate reductase